MSYVSLIDSHGVASGGLGPVVQNGRAARKRKALRALRLDIEEQRVVPGVQNRVPVLVTAREGAKGEVQRRRLARQRLHTV